MPMCRLSDAELNCVRTKMRLTSECRHELIGMSIRRYLPAIGTAGFDRRSVSGKRRCPRPPPRMMASTSFMPDRVCKTAGGHDGAAVQFDDVLRNRQPDAKPPGPARCRGVGLTKAIEHIRKKVGGDALA